MSICSVRPQIAEFHHEYFRKGRPDLLRNIKRKARQVFLSLSPLPAPARTTCVNEFARLNESIRMGEGHGVNGKSVHETAGLLFLFIGTKITHGKRNAAVVVSCETQTRSTLAVSPLVCRAASPPAVAVARVTVTLTSAGAIRWRGTCCPRVAWGRADHLHAVQCRPRL